MHEITEEDFEKIQDNLAFIYNAIGHNHDALKDNDLRNEANLIEEAIKKIEEAKQNLFCHCKEHNPSQEICEVCNKFIQMDLFGIYLK